MPICHSYQSIKKEDVFLWDFPGTGVPCVSEANCYSEMRNTQAGILTEPWHENHQVYRYFITVPILRQVWFSKYCSKWAAVWSAYR